MKQAFCKSDPRHILASQPRDRLIVAMSVRMARAALGLSQAELGGLLGMSQRGIHRVEQGHSEPRRTTLLAIEGLLNKAGLKIEDRSDGGFCITVSAAILGESGVLNVVAPSLSDCSPLAEDSEVSEPASEDMLR